MQTLSRAGEAIADLDRELRRVERRSTVYHVGDLMFDRLENPVLDKAARAIYREYERGEVFLTQRKLGTNRYEYRSTRAYRLNRGRK